MGLDAEVFINNSILERFKKLQESGRLAHAYLLIGPEGVGKFQTALAVADWLIGGDDPQLRMRIRNGNHPDVHVIRSRRGETIKIEQIRELTAATQMRPYEAQKSFFIIENIENLTMEGGNALLKTLEEPSESSQIILTTSIVERNLSTILSRCHAIYFPPVSSSEAAKLLSGQGASREEAHFLAMYTAGCPQKAQVLYDSKIMDRKNDIIDQMVFGSGADALLKKIGSDKDATKELLDVLLSWHRDLLLIKSGARENQLVHIDRLDALARAAQAKNFDEIKSIINEIVRAAKQLSDNLNVKVALMVIKERVWVK